MKLRRPAFASHRQSAPHRHSATSGLGSPTPLAVLLAIMTGILAVPLVLLLAFAPRPLVLPLFGMGALALSAAFACLAWWQAVDWKGSRVTLWDIAGALAFIGFAAVLLSDPETVLPLLGQN
jgi:hypothetical protein